MGGRKCGTGSRRWLAGSLVVAVLGLAPAGAMAEDEAPTQKERKAQALERFDRNGDGKLGPAERQEARKARRAEQTKRWDTDGDGKVSREERAAGRKAQRESKTRRKAAAASEASE